MTKLTYLEIAPTKPVKSIVILLHGLGANGHNIAPIVQQLNLPSSTLFIMPHAPQRSITINQHVKMPAWYDVHEVSLDAKEDDHGILSSNEQIQELLNYCSSIVASENIFLMGFSQGGAMSLFSGLSYNKPLGGIISLSAYTPIKEILHTKLHAANINTQLFMGHGLYDEVVPLLFGELSYQYLLELKYKINWHTYKMGHEIIQNEIMDILVESIMKNLDFELSEVTL